MIMLSNLTTLVSSQVVAMLVTVAGFELGRRLQRLAGGSPLVHPVPIAIAIVVAYLEISGTNYDTYLQDTNLLMFLLQLAIVALALPLYDNLHRIRDAAPAVLAGVAAAGVAAVVTTAATAWLLGASPDVLRSVLPKSVTAGVAISISQEIGGLPSLTAVLTVSTGILGAMTSGKLFRWARVTDWDARGIATGSVCHAIGTAQILAENEGAGAFAGLGLVLNALLTGIALPLAMRCLGL